VKAIRLLSGLWAGSKSKSALTCCYDLSPQFRTSYYPELAVVGGGSLQADLLRLASQLGVAERVTWTGEVQDAEAMMPGFDVFALTSDYEAMLYALLEAQSAGLPVVATRVGGVETVIAHGRNGLIAEPQDVSSLAALMSTLIEHEETRKRMSEEALVVAERFSIDLMVERTLDGYRQRSITRCGY
jgi:glycosyltransferase involved in cell wall biosynthesis